MTAEPSPDKSEDRTSGVQTHWVGQTLRGTYRILEVLDHGGMGAVFAAEHLRLKRRVAVKVLANHLTSNSHALDRFNREAEIISQLQHPNIVHVLDFDTTDEGEPYLVMELLQGESLGTRLERESRIGTVEAARIAMQVASGLAAAHRAGVVHRDLKPANIFLVQMPDQSMFVKLLDFGISKRSGVGRGLTGEFDILGTPEYMAPEQALGKTALVDHRGDQYSLAVITYEMLAGATPFVGADVMETLRKVINADPPPLTALVPSLPPEMDAVIRRALSKEPEDRFDSVLEFATALAQATGHASLSPPEGLTARAPTIPAPGKKVGTGDIAVRPRASVRPPSPFEGRPTEPQVRERLSSYPDSGETNPVGDIQTLLGQARSALELENAELAVELAENALRIAETSGNENAKQAVERAATLLNRIFVARLGELNRRPVVCQVPSSDSSAVSSEQAFILSRLDGSTNVEEVLDLTPMPRQQTLRLLVGLLRRGLIDVV